jgi:metallo-beta-lactamase class B
MPQPRLITVAIRVVGLLVLGAGNSQAQCQPPGWNGPDAWSEPFPGHRIIGNLYAVGTADLSVFLIATDAGHILINTGLQHSTPLIRRNIESLGFRLEDVRILLAMQSHFDHTAALAEIKRLSGAEMWATAGDAPVLEDGGASDAQYGECAYSRFPRIKVDEILADGDLIEIGGVRLTTHVHAGHTRGSSSYSMTVRENDRDYAVLIANMGSVNPGKRLVVNPTYPGVADDYAATFRKQKAMHVDVWVAAHSSQYGRDDKYTPGEDYGPDTFIDPAGFLAAVERHEKLFLEQVSREGN